MPISRWDRARKMELLAGIPLFSANSQRELAQVAALTVPMHFDAGAVLTREGQSGGLAFVIAEGQAAVLRGKRRLAVLGPGEVVGELSLIDGQPRSATVEALTDLEVLEISGDDLARLMRKAPSVRRKLLEALAGRLRQADRLPTAGL